MNEPGKVTDTFNWSKCCKGRAKVNKRKVVIAVAALMCCFLISIALFGFLPADSGRGQRADHGGGSAF